MPTALPVEVPSGPPSHPLFASFARRSLAGEALSRDEALAVLHTPDDELGALLQAAYAVRQAQWGNRVKVCVLQNARSGLCPEDCGYCSQSSVSTAEIETYRLLSQETRERVEAAVEALPESQRLVIRLRDIEGFPSEEVCGILGISEGNQRVLLHRARSRVREALESYLDETV